MARQQKKKLRLNKNTIFLGLIQKYRAYDFSSRRIIQNPANTKCSLVFFKKNYVVLMNIFYVVDLLAAWRRNLASKYNLVYDILYYYASIYNNNSVVSLKTHKIFDITKNINMIIFSIPAKQLFLMFFKIKPVFIFTGGLMRIVMHEKRKSSKKLYKVAISLIKLFTILLTKKNFFQQGYLKLINIGRLRVKILNSLSKIKTTARINYILIKFRTDFTSQKLETRRSIKKYIKKRFKIR